MTWGEVNEYVEAAYERDRRRNKDLALIGFQTAAAINQFFCGGGQKLKVEEFYPYWTDEEKTQLRIERLKDVLRK